MSYNSFRTRLRGYHNRGIKHRGEPVGRVFVMETIKRIRNSKKGS